MSPGEALIVVLAGFLGGGVNAIAGGGTLLTYPALLAVGLPPVAANTTSSVGLLAGYASGSVAYRRELEGQTGRTRRLLVSAGLGGVLGAVLLLALPGESFETVVPYLVLASSLLLAVQPRLAKVLEARGRAGVHPGWEVQLGVAVAAVYGSYFGAGLGVVLLAVLGVLVADDLQRLNALKGVLSLLINLVAALIFVVTGHVDWVAAGLVAVGAVLGATLGVGLARRLPAVWVRAGVVAAGVVVAVALLLP